MDFITNNAALADVPAVKNQNYVVVPLAYVMHDLSAVVACQDFAEVSGYSGTAGRTGRPESAFTENL